MDKKNIVFYFPYRVVGGVSVLFLRLATLLRHEFNIYLMDYDDGYMATNLPEDCFFIKHDQPHLIPENSTIIFQSTPLWRIPFIDEFPRNCRVFFWNLHPRNFQSNYVRMDTKRRWLLPLNFFSFLRRRKLRSMVEFLMIRKSLTFMDGENYEKTKQDLSLNKHSAQYLPILTNSPVICGNFTLDINKIECLWVGRLDNFKIEILLFLLKALDDLKNDNMNFSIIGSGEESYRVEEISQTFTYLNVNLLGDVSLAQLDETIVNYDIVFAMGTSALDAAKLYKPVICLDFSYTPVPEGYQFHMIYDNRHYNVAEEITDKHLGQENNIATIIDKICNSYRKESLSSYKYWENNHSVDVVKDNLMQLLSTNGCTLQEIFTKQFHRPDFITRLLNILICYIKKPIHETDIHII